MPKITKPLKPGDEKRSITTTSGVGAIDAAERWRAGGSIPGAEEIDDLIDEFLNIPISRVDGRMTSAIGCDGDWAWIERGEDFLPRDLLHRLLCRSLSRTEGYDEARCLKALASEDDVALVGDPDYPGAEGDGLWIAVRAGGDDPLGYVRISDFFDGWREETLRWLIPRLGIAPSKLRVALDQLLPEE
jgi:hypothetical protein